MTLRCVHIGVGVRGQHWLAIVRDYPEAIPVACVDPQAAMLEIVSRTYPSVRCFSDLDKALEETEANVAIIASPVDLHFQHAMACLDRGLVVLVEKPFAATMEEAVRLVQQSEASGCPILVAQNYRFNPAERTIRHLIEEDLLGRLSSVYCTARRFRPAKGGLATLDYPQLIDDGVHHFDSIRGILQRNPSRVIARRLNPPGSPYNHGAMTEALIAMDDDIHVQYVGSLMGHRYGFSLWCEGEKGVLWTNRKWVAWRKRGTRLFRPLKRVDVPKGDEAPYPRAGTTSLLNGVRDALLTGRQAETSGRDNLWTLAMVEAGIRSDREHRDVPIDEVFPSRGLGQSG